MRLVVEASAAVTLLLAEDASYRWMLRISSKIPS